MQDANAEGKIPLTLPLNHLNKAAQPCRGSPNATTVCDRVAGALLEPNASIDRHGPGGALKGGGSME
jgi:hypothetical protein